MSFFRKNYNAWNVADTDYPKNGSIHEQVKFILNYAVLAASTFNSQPWRCKIKGNILEVFLDLERMPKISDKSGRFGLISIGCFIENFIIAAEHYGYEVSVQLFVNDYQTDQLIAKLKIEDRKSELSDDKSLFKYITKRVTNRSISEDIKISEEVIKYLENLSQENFSVIVLNEQLKDQLISISMKSDIQIWSDIEFKKEHVGWVRNNLTYLFDGMPAFGVGIPLIPSFLARPVILSSKFASMQAAKNKAALQSSRNFVLLCSDENQREWVKLGMIYQKIALYLTSKRLAASPMGQFIEVDEGRESLRELTASKTDFAPQMFFRIGYPTKEVRHSPRRLVTDILMPI